MKLKETYNYTVWVGGTCNYHTDYDKAIEDFDEWVEDGYDDVVLSRIDSDTIKDNTYEVLSDTDLLFPINWKYETINQ